MGRKKSLCCKNFSSVSKQQKIPEIGAFSRVVMETFLRYGSLTFFTCFGLGWINARCPPKPLYHSPLLSWTGERKYERLEGQDKEREGSLTSYCHRQNRLNLGRKRKFNLSQIKSE